TLGGVRQFRTGDVGRINAKGQLELTGRRDARIKIRGNRVELSEVENALLRLPSVEQAVVDAIERENKEPVLVSYIVTGDRHSWSRARLRTQLRSLVPNCMVPSVFLLLKSFPLTASGKVDRTELRERARVLLRHATSSEPATETETLIIRIWAEALDLDDVGRTAAFFELGGDSLVATVIAARLHDMMRVDLDFGAFVEFPILKNFAAFVDETRPNPNTLPLSCLKPNEPALLSVVQEYYWRRSLDPTRSAGLTMA